MPKRAAAAASAADEGKPPAKSPAKKPKAAKPKPKAEKVVLDRDATPRADPSAVAAGAPLVRICLWNVGGVRALLKSDERRALLQRLLSEEQPDVLCLQEHKLQETHLAEVEADLRELAPSHTAHWAVSVPPAKKGYSGVVALVRDGIAAALPRGEGLTAIGRGVGGEVEGKGRKGKKKAQGDASIKSFFAAKDAAGGGDQAGGAAAGSDAATEAAAEAPCGLLSVHEGLGVPVALDRDYNIEGRVLTLDLGSFSLVLAYVPNSGQDLKRLDYRIDTWEEDLKAHLKALEELGKPVVYVGDLNVAHLDLDIWNVGAKHLAKSAGTTPQEREAMGRLLDAGFVDTFRALHPNARHAYTFWSVRAGNRPWNRGLRLDYCISSASMSPSAAETQLPRVVDSFILDHFNTNGDHAPVGCVVAVPPIEK